MPIRIYPNTITRIEQQPPTGDLCRPQAGADRPNLVDAPYETYYRTFTPLTSISPACRVCDGSKKFVPQNGIAVEEQNYRQISGFADLITGTGTPSLVDICYTYNGRPWGRLIELRTQQIACDLNDTPNPQDYNGPTREEANINFKLGYASIPANISTNFPLQYRVGNDLRDPGANQYSSYSGQNVRGYATQFAFGADGESHLSSFNLSTADLLTIYDYSKSSSFITATTDRFSRSRYEVPLPTLPDEPTRFERKIDVQEDEAQYLYHMYFEKSRLRGELPEV